MKTRGNPVGLGLPSAQSRHRLPHYRHQRTPRSPTSTIAADSFAIRSSDYRKWEAFVSTAGDKEPWRRWCNSRPTQFRANDWLVVYGLKNQASLEPSFFLIADIALERL